MSAALIHPATVMCGRSASRAAHLTKSSPPCVKFISLLHRYVNICRLNRISQSNKLNLLVVSNNKSLILAEKHIERWLVHAGARTSEHLADGCARTRGETARNGCYVSPFNTT